MRENVYEHFRFVDEYEVCPERNIILRLRELPAALILPFSLTLNPLIDILPKFASK